MAAARVGIRSRIWLRRYSSEADSKAALVNESNPPSPNKNPSLDNLFQAAPKEKKSFKDIFGKITVQEFVSLARKVMAKILTEASLRLHCRLCLLQHRRNLACELHSKGSPNSRSGSEGPVKARAPAQLGSLSTRFLMNSYFSLAYQFLLSKKTSLTTEGIIYPLSKENLSVIAFGEQIFSLLKDCFLACHYVSMKIGQGLSMNSFESERWLQCGLSSRCSYLDDVTSPLDRLDPKRSIVQVSFKSM